MTQVTASTEDSTTRAARENLAPAGGPLGRYASAAARSWVTTVVPLVGLSALTMAVALFERGYCISNGWGGPSQFWRACYSDLPVLYSGGGLASGLPDFLQAGGGQVAQPPLTGAVLALVGGLVPAGGSEADQARIFFLFFALLATALVAALVWLTAAARPRHASLAAHVALAPVLVMAVLVSADIVGVVLATAGIWAWARRRPVLAGALLGLGIAARTYPVLIVIALALLALRSGRGAAVRRMLVAAVLAVVVVAVPFLLGNTSALTAPYAAWRSTGAGLGSVWVLPQLAGHPLPTGIVTALAVLGMVVAVGFGAWLALAARRRPSLAELSLVMVAVLLVTGAALPVQSSLWLVPLVALAGVRWREHVVWAFAEGLNFVAVWLYLGGQSAPDRGLPPAWYAVFLLVRVLAIGYLAVAVWRRATARAEHDPTEDTLAEDLGPAFADPDRDEVLDELAGDFTNAPDRLVVRLG